MTRQSSIDHVTRYFDSGNFVRDLSLRVAHKTESQKNANGVALSAYLNDEIEPAFNRMGFKCRIFDNPVSPDHCVLLAERIEVPDQTTVLGYGHGDVVHGQDELWKKGAGPWQIKAKGERMYGRGTADNKSQHTINMAALHSVLETRGRLGFNAKFIIEMGEEVGSPGLHEIVASNPDVFAADVLIASDGPRVSADRPTLTLGARGGVTFELQVNLHEGAHHSGNWGGLIADPAIRLAHAIASITNATGRINIPEWLPPPTSDAVKESLIGIEVYGGENAPTINPRWGEPNLTPAEKVYSWNSFAVLALTSGNPDNPVNAISASARAHCQLRYFAGTDRASIIPALRKHLDQHGFDDVDIVDTPVGGSTGFAASRTEPDHPWVKIVRDSIQTTCGSPPATIPSMGGSICNDIFTDLLQIPAIWIPHSYPGCSQHAPDEHILVPLTRSAMQIMAGLYWDIGDSTRTP